MYERVRERKNSRCDKSVSEKLAFFFLFAHKSWGAHTCDTNTHTHSLIYESVNLIHFK